MAKKRKAVKRASSKSSKKLWYKAETYGIQYNSLTFLLFLLFVLLVSMILVSKALGMSLY